MLVARVGTLKPRKKNLRGRFNVWFKELLLARVAKSHTFPPFIFASAGEGLDKSLSCA